MLIKAQKSEAVVYPLEAGCMPTHNVSQSRLGNGLTTMAYWHTTQHAPQKYSEIPLLISLTITLAFKIYYSGTHVRLIADIAEQASISIVHFQITSC